MAKVKLLSLLTASLGLVSAYNLKPLTPVPSGRSPHHGNRTSTPSPPTVNGPGSAGLPLSRLGPHDISSLSINTSATIHHTPSTQVPDWLSFSYSQSSAPTPNPWTDVGYTIGITIITPEPVTLTSTHDQAQPQTTLTTISTPTTTSTLVPSTQPHGPDMPTTKNPAIILTARQCDPKSDGW